MTRDELRDGWLDLMGRLYDAASYFERFDALFVESRLPLGSAKMAWLRRHRPLRYLASQAETILGALGMLLRVWSDPRTRRDRPVYARSLRKLLAAGRPPRYLFQLAWKCILHTHFATMTHQMAREGSRLVNT
jgi:hypothetical protein